MRGKIIFCKVFHYISDTVYPLSLDCLHYLFYLLISFTYKVILLSKMYQYSQRNGSLSVKWTLILFKAKKNCWIKFNDWNNYANSIRPIHMRVHEVLWETCQNLFWSINISVICSLWRWIQKYIIWFYFHGYYLSF